MLAFTTAPAFNALALPLRVTRALILQEARSRTGIPKGMHSAPTPRKQMVSGSFHPPSGVLFTFPSRYLFAIDLKKYLALGR